MFFWVIMDTSLGLDKPQFLHLQMEIAIDISIALSFTKCFHANYLMYLSQFIGEVRITFLITLI